MNFFFPGIIIALSIIVFSGCDKDNYYPNTNFNLLYLNITNDSTGPLFDEVTINSRIHEYTFKLSEQKEIYRIGYQSHPDVPDGAYTIEIYDANNSQSLYLATHSFLSSETSYITPGETIVLYPNISYIIRRTQNNLNSLEWRGRAATGIMTFPYIYGYLTIINSKYYLNGGTMENFALPYIDIVYKE
jgi:hypothetical protein